MNSAGSFEGVDMLELNVICLLIVSFACVCRFEFCWLCQGSWAEHGERTGGFYNCNRWALDVFYSSRMHGLSVIHTLIT